MDLKNLGEKIKTLRLQHGLTQREAAVKIGITAASMSAYENGTQNPSATVIASIADLFNVKTDWLLGRTIEPYSSFVQDEYCDFDVPSALYSFLDLIRHRAIIDFLEENDNDPDSPCVITLESDGFRRFVFNARQIIDFVKNDIFEPDIGKVYIDQLVSICSKEIANDIRTAAQRGDPDA